MSERKSLPDFERKSRRSTRIKACELAAQCLQGQGLEGSIGPRLMSITVFFENYIDAGCNETDKRMALLERRGRGKLKLMAGGGLT